MQQPPNHGTPDGDHPHGGAADPDTWVVVGSYRFRGFASFVASALEGSGIAARVVGDDAGGVLVGMGIVTGINVEVPAQDAEAARELLSSLPADDEALEGWRDAAGDAEDGDRSERGASDGSDAGYDIPAVPRSAWRGVLIGALVVVLALTVGLALFELA